MDNLIEKIKEYVMEECRKYKEASEEHYAENTGWYDFYLFEYLL